MDKKAATTKRQTNPGRVFVGTSGWQYKHWRSVFFPETLKVKDQFLYYRSQFETVELNASFYHIPAQKTFEKWALEVEPDFIFSVKANRFFTHLKKLDVSPEDISGFTSRALALKEHLGPILFQLPPSWKMDLERLQHFLSMLPDTIKAVFEFRNPSWYQSDVYDLLKRYDTAFCIYDLGGHFSPKVVSAGFAYMRLHGPGAKYQGSYTFDFLKEIAAYVQNWLDSGKDVYVYFDNDQNGYAPKNAATLKTLLSN